MFVPETRVRSGVDALVDAASQRAANLAKDLRENRINIEQFRDGMFQTIKDVHVAAGLAAYGGRNAMDQERYGFLGSEIKKQYIWARKMLADIIDGTQPMNGRLDARAAFYAASARQTYEAARQRQQKESGKSEERNNLTARESCSGCQAETNRGWVPIGSLIPPGGRTCRGNCRCFLTYRAVSGRKRDAA